MRDQLTVSVRSLTLACLLSLAPGHAALSGGHTSDGAPKPKVSAATQTELQQWMTRRLEHFDAKYFGWVETMNDGAEYEVRTPATEWSDFDLRVTRGESMQKAGRMLALGKKTSPGRGSGVLRWSRFYSLDLHPKTPLVGMLHATIVMQMYDDDSVTTGGWLGVLPGTRVEPDLALLKQVTDDYFARHGKDPSLYRRLICKGTEDTVAEFRRKPACSGVSFYGPPVYRDDPEASIQFIAGLYEEFVDTYMRIAEDRADDPFTAADLRAQETMRRSWLIDQLFSDPFAAKIVPFEIWSFQNVPPVITF